MSHIDQFFPGLQSSEWRVTSPQDDGYNCIAWAAGEDDVWWEPDPMDQYFWPSDIPRKSTVSAFVEAFGQRGFQPCDSYEVQEGFEKVAVYTDRDGTPTHMARQLPSGRWTSKLGGLEDIEHDLEALEGSGYGRVAVVMGRPREAVGSENDES